MFQTQGPIVPHCIVPLPNSNGVQLLLCYDNEGVYVNTYGRVSKNIVLQVKISIQHVFFTNFGREKVSLYFKKDKSFKA